MIKNLGFPVISASRSKEQPYRINRLQTLLGWIQGRAFSESCSWEIEHNLLGLNDHKGALRAIWLFEPSDLAKEIVFDAWAVQKESAVEHWSLSDESDTASSFSAFRPDMVPNYHGELMEQLSSRRAVLIERKTVALEVQVEPPPTNLF
jgi:hypothetical protein